MATTPIYNWPTPDNTDLVKNGALAIRTLGDAIDTTMDTMVEKTIVDAKGDLIAATAADTVARIAVGANGTVLKANSATATGLEWATDASGMTNPMTTTGDMIYSSSGSTPARLGIGTAGQVIGIAAGVPAWTTPAGGGGGKVLQVVSATHATRVDNSTSSFVDTGLTATITPSAATSKIVVAWGIDWRKDQANSQNAGQFKLLRGATLIVQSDGIGYNNSAITNIGTWAGTFQDSPATTSATTYKIQQASENNTLQFSTIPFNTTSLASIVLMEIGA